MRAVLLAVAATCASAFMAPSPVSLSRRPLRLSQSRSAAVRVPRASPVMMANIKERTVRAPVFDEVCEQTGITLTRYMMEVSRANPELRDLESLISGIQQACKTISSLVDRATITGMVGYANGGGSINVQGEEQKKLDVVTNDVLKRALRFTGKVGIIASEEEDVPVFNKDAYKVPGGEGKYQDVTVDIGSKYVTVFDPLDGSSNVDANIPTGTIFGVYEEAESMENCMVNDDSVEGSCLLNTLQPGDALVASGYCLYSSSCMFVFTIGAGVNGFTYDRSIGEFVLTHPNIQLPKRGKIYSMNEANRWDWDKPLQDYVTAIQTGQGQTKAKYSSRYIGSMVGDVHRTLLYGGIFGYPADKKNKDGKLRLLYEAAPMSFLMEQAGGLSLTGKTRIMDLVPQKVHQRVPFLAGSYDDVMEMRSYYDACDDPEIIKRCLARLEGSAK
ncbi:hypothetical protein GUITHDRAFT_97957 [Guillardia theta CCMP2712]|uniref:fructose-bisphosphatase n=3 Tax=Guillardia theta TaxID=55529 RepID=L1IGJ0_GUITC|nr:hypothetical protein GUITHDRAFT_97957 [Guillardia theta CCMP2712]ABF68595.1 chloroplast fructose-1,6-bisphosphatase [Guillardia theta]EKX34950.1 hypothetical protein GUITHDRAFT_97957 [Guillardia theta CCMP2712]|eukprot:XP_005821930.1 hypothetical protein GUITHDRAFT_97957 [Guillardia theta CCMP2712]